MLKILFIIILFFNFSYADEYKTVNIKSEIIKFLEKNKISGNPNLNGNISHLKCIKNINIKDKFGDFKTLEISCPDKSSWKYNLRTKVKNIKVKKQSKKIIKNKNSVVKVSRNLKKGQIISKDDLFIGKTSFTMSSDLFSTTEELIGRKIKHSIREGQFLRERHMKKDWLILEGQPVIIEKNINNIIVSANGTVLKPAMLGDITEVLNDSSGKIIKAWVINNEKVSINR